jgi:UDP-N-acetylglucosamine transferase subunit ALG13
VIFATVGSTQIPFERFVRALEALPGEQLLVQHGPVEPPASAARTNAFMQFPQMIESMEAADVVVCHAGAGSILCALRAGHTPVVVPRLKRYQETVDDHQVEFSRALATDGKVIAVEDLDDLAAAVKAAPPRCSAGQRSGLLPIQAAVREALHASPSLN